MAEPLLDEQLMYYRARAQEYDVSLGQTEDSHLADPRPEMQEWRDAVQALRAIGPRRSILELAGGTGIWTRELVELSSDLHVIDGSPEMLAINQEKLGDNRIEYSCEDLFSWQPDRKYDLVFFAFWLSHIPPDRLLDFLDRLAEAVAEAGYVFMVDEPAGGAMLSGPSDNGMVQKRQLKDGQVFRIVKVYYDPAVIREELRLRGLLPVRMVTGNYFFHLVGERLA